MTKPYNTKELQFVLDYWTDERKAKAEPVLPPKISYEKVNNLTNKNDYMIIPQSNSDNSSSIISEPYEVDVNERPYFCGGKFFFTIGEGDDAQDKFGSAQFVGHSQVLLTAAHCVRDNVTGDYYKNFLFSRGYKETNGETEGQDFAIERVLTPEEWVSDPINIAFDYAFCWTTTPYSDWMGMQIGISQTEIHAIGYPGNYIDGKIMYGVDGTKGEIINNIVRMKGNPMRHGNSGGAWIGNLSNERRWDTNLAIGLYSSTPSDNEKDQLSPLFNQDTIDLFNTIINGDEL
ncbi:trypsin-like serine peptidase [Bacillus sp. BR_16]|uniref:trypsin-like serine peptidase n=1 Tax=Bacillus sp. BR_16 TaxID=3055777 RepID=UPI0035C1A5A1